MQLSVDTPKKLAPIWNASRYKILYGGRGSGKSWTVARTLLARGVIEPLRILCAREIQKTISDSVHRLLSDQIVTLGLEGHYTIQESSIRGENGTEFVFTGLRHQDVGKIKSFEGVDIVWCEEAQVITKKSWEILIPTIRKPKSEIWITFNPELDSDETYQRFVAFPPEDSLLMKVNWSDNPWFPDVLRAEKDALFKRDPESYRNIWEGECRSAVEGAIYSREVATLYEEKRFRPVPHDPLLAVHTVWDLGWNDQMSIILAQRTASEIRIIEYIEDSHRTLAEYVSDLDRKPYKWGKDWLPHDGRAKDYKSGRSAEEILQALRRDVQIVPEIGVEAGIKAARLIFGRTFFDETRAERLVHCLKRYRRAINQTTNEPGPPLHDEFSHGADAFRYLGVIADQMRNDGNDLGDYYKAFRRYG